MKMPPSDLVVGLLEMGLNSDRNADLVPVLE